MSLHIGCRFQDYQKTVEKIINEVVEYPNGSMTFVNILNINIGITHEKDFCI